MKQNQFGLRNLFAVVAALGVIFSFQFGREVSLLIAAGLTPAALISAIASTK